MAIRELVAADDGILTQPALKVKAFDKSLRALLDDMWETMAANGGQGLAAPQLGVPMRVLIAQRGPRRIELINPCILKVKKPIVLGEESCLSLPGIRVNVPRAYSVVLQGRDATGKQIQVSAVDMLARCLQHEFDHLDGILITKRGRALRAPRVAKSA